MRIVLPEVYTRIVPRDSATIPQCGVIRWLRFGVNLRWAAIGAGDDPVHLGDRVWPAMFHRRAGIPAGGRPDGFESRARLGRDASHSRESCPYVSLQTMAFCCKLDASPIRGLLREFSFSIQYENEFLICFCARGSRAPFLRLARVWIIL